MSKNPLNQLVEKIKKTINKFKTDIIKQYFEIGKLIIENQSKFSSKEELLINISEQLGDGFGKANLSEMRRLYEIYSGFPEQFKLAKQLGWSQNRTLLRIENDFELREELLLFAIENKNISEKELKSELIKRQGQKQLKTIGFKINIETIEIKNFKSIVDMKIEKPYPFSVFVGSNACGKSNIFQAIDFLFNSYYNSPLKTFNDYGGNQLFNFYKTDSNIEISLNTGFNEKIYFVNNLKKNSIYNSEIKEPYNGKFINQFCFLSIKEGINTNNKSRILEKDGSNFKTILKEKIFFDIPTKEAFIRKLKNAVSDISEVNIEKSEIDGTNELIIKDKNYPDIKISEMLVSDGTKKMIILLTAILQSKEPQFICIEEPENGLHPLILESFIDTIRNICKDEGHFIWFTTHSPTFVKHLKRNELIIVDKKDGQTKIKKASDKIFDDYFSEEDLQLDDAWLSDIFEGGLPW